MNESSSSETIFTTMVQNGSNLHEASFVRHQQEVNLSIRTGQWTRSSEVVQTSSVTWFPRFEAGSGTVVKKKTCGVRSTENITHVTAFLFCHNDTRDGVWTRVWTEAGPSMKTDWLQVRETSGWTRCCYVTKVTPSLRGGSWFWTSDSVTPVSASTGPHVSVFIYWSSFRGSGLEDFVFVSCCNRFCSSVVPCCLWVSLKNHRKWTSHQLWRL